MGRHAPRARGLLLAVIAGAIAPVTAAQCSIIAHSASVSAVFVAPYVYTVTDLPDGGMVVGGSFTSVGGGIPAWHVAVWRDGIWTTLGPGLGGSGASDGVMCTAVMPNGDIVAGGTFTSAGTVVVNSVARWNGYSWQALGTGFPSPFYDSRVEHMLVMPNGDLVVAGRFGFPFPWLARWNGSTWSSIGGGGWEVTEALAVTPNGDLLVAYNSSAGARVMRWDGAAWTQLGSGSTQWFIYDLDVSPSGVVTAAGHQPSVAYWNGSTWTPVGGSFMNNLVFGWVFDIHRLPNGDLIAGGDFNSPGNHIARWNGSSWQPLGSGILESGINALVFDMALLANGHFALGGLFSNVNGVSTANVATLSSTCGPTATSYGAGCSGSAGLVTLVATQWPMLGGTMRGRTTGLAANSLAVGVWGFSQTNIPLSSGHPLGGPGCSILVADEILIEFLTGVGAVESVISVPNDLNLLGATFHHQVVPIELDANGNMQAITSSNALTLTFGSF